MFKSFFQKNTQKSILDLMSIDNPLYSELEMIESAKISFPLMKKVKMPDGTIGHKFIKAHGEYLDIRPCCLEMNDGAIHENVYISSVQDYNKQYGNILPENILDINDVAHISVSINRVEQRFSHQIMKERDKFKDVAYFGVEFFNKKKYIMCIGGDFMDFMKYPKGLTSNDIKSIFTAPKSRRNIRAGNCDFKWCLL